MYTYRISHVGSCPRALTAERLQLKASELPSFLETSAQEGKKHEDWIVESLKIDKVFVSARQLEISLDVNEKIHLLGHIDGIVTDENDHSSLVEIKTMSQYEFDRWLSGGFEEFHTYAVQHTCYMEALGIYTGIYIVKNRSSGTIDLYDGKEHHIQKPKIIDGEFHILSDKITDYQVIGTPYSMELLINDLEVVEKCLENKELFPKPYNPYSVECRRCGYKEYCIEEPHYTEQELPVLLKATEDWRKGKELEKEANELLNGAEIVLQTHGVAKNRLKYAINNLGISIFPNKPRISYDKKILEETFTSEQLSPALKTSKPEKEYQMRIYDHLKKE